MERESQSNAFHCFFFFSLSPTTRLVRSLVPFGGAAVAVVVGFAGLPACCRCRPPRQKPFRPSFSVSRLPHLVVSPSSLDRLSLSLHLSSSSWTRAFQRKRSRLGGGLVCTE
jgi:hypothetical protein